MLILDEILCRCVDNNYTIVTIALIELSEKYNYIMPICKEHTVQTFLIQWLLHYFKVKSYGTLYTCSKNNICLYHDYLAFYDIVQYLEKDQQYYFHGRVGHTSFSRKSIYIVACDTLSYKQQ